MENTYSESILYKHTVIPIGKIFDIFGLKIVCDDTNLRICKSDLTQVINLSRKGFSIHNLIANFVYVLLSKFYSCEVHKSIKVIKTLKELHEREGRLNFEWQTKIHLKENWISKSISRYKLFFGNKSNVIRCNYTIITFSPSFLFVLYIVLLFPLWTRSQPRSNSINCKYIP